MRNLLRLLAARHASFVIMTASLFAAFQFLICAAVASVDVGEALEAFMHYLPPMLQSVLASTFFGGFSAHGLLAFGWNHPIAQAAGAAVAIVLATRAVAGEAEAGTIELALSQPLSRMHYLAAQVGFALGALVVLSLVGVAGTLLGQRFFGLEPFPAGAILRLAGNYLLLQWAWFGVALLLSAWGREAGRVASVAFLIALASYIVRVIGQFWDRLAFLMPLALQYYFSPQDILVAERGVARPALVLLSITVVTTALAAWRFRRRDLP
jgi:ABC-type transport system involved in multi-copper enzyme maturation permease subunit